MFLEFNPSDLGVILAVCLSGAIIIFAFVVFTINIIKRTKKTKKVATNPINSESELVIAFGKDNIKKVDMEMSRITITLDNVDMVDTEKIKSLGASGVLIVGNQIKCSFKEDIEAKYNELKGAVVNE